MIPCDDCSQEKGEECIVVALDLAEGEELGFAKS